MRVASVRGKEKLGTCGHCGKFGHESKACYNLLVIRSGGLTGLEVPRKERLMVEEADSTDVAEGWCARARSSCT